VRDGTRRHVAAYWGGTAFNWVRNRAAYITSERPDSFWFDQYISSARKFRTAAAERHAPPTGVNPGRAGGGERGVRVDQQPVRRPPPLDPPPREAGSATRHASGKRAPVF
jgi:hypothetical protein